MAVKGPTPRFGGGWSTKEKEIVRVLIHDARDLADLAEKMIDAHGPDGFFIAFWGERGFQDAQDGIAEIFAELFQAQTKWAKQELWVGPCSPLFCVDRIGELIFLLGRRFGQNVVDGIDDFLDRYALVLAFEEVWNDVS